MMETGLWILLVVSASAFTFCSFVNLGKLMVFLHLIAMVFFFGLAMVHGSGDAIAQTASITDGTTTWTETKTWIAGGEDSYWITYFFQGLGIMNLALFIKRMMMSDKP